MEIPQNILLGLVMSNWSQEWRDAVVFFQTKENWFALIEGGTAKKIPLVAYVAWQQRPGDLRSEAGHYYLASQHGYPNSAKYWQRFDQPVPEWERLHHFCVSKEEAERYLSAIKVLNNKTNNSVTITTNDTSYSTNDTIGFIGQTQSYVFLRNLKRLDNLIIPIMKIKANHFIWDVME